MTTTTTARLLRLSLAVSAALTLCGVSEAQGRTGAMSEAQARYQQERAACLNGQTSQDRATCLKEAGAALLEARRGNLTDGQGQLDRNAMERCKVLSGAERTDCIDRMHGAGTVEGSVSGGGILREKVTIEPAPAGSTKP